jgi:superfamily II DNA or RNA helicase
MVGFMVFTGTRYQGSRFSKRAEWSYLLNSLAKQTDRNDLIENWLAHDVKNGRTILVMSERRMWCFNMAAALTKRGIKARAIVGGLAGAKAKAERQKVIDDTMAGNVDVILATQTFKAGLDIPVLDTVYMAFPGNNAPQLEQILGRARRPYAGKNLSVFRYFADEGHGLLYGCMRGTHKALRDLGINVVPLKIGTKPTEVASQMTFDTKQDPDSQQTTTSASRSGLRRHSVKSSSLDVFLSDAQAAQRDSAKYRDRFKQDKKG